MTTSRPERPSLPAQKAGAPNSSPSAGQIVGERRAREVKTARRRPNTKMAAVSLKLPPIIIEAADELMRIGPYTSRAAVIRSIIIQELPRHLARYQEAVDEAKELPIHDNNDKRKNISIFMPKQMFADIKKMAKELGISVSELIRISIDHFYREYQFYRSRNKEVLRK
jgi:Arc/MetJ-type ribon-helix-helix transcriptional regulator